MEPMRQQSKPVRFLPVSAVWRAVRAAMASPGSLGRNGLQSDGGTVVKGDVSGDLRNSISSMGLKCGMKRCE